MDTVDLYGTNKEGVQVHLGKAPSLHMKTLEIAMEKFGPFEEDDGSDADLCLSALEQLIEWMFKQGYRIPEPAAQPKGGTPT